MFIFIWPNVLVSTTKKREVCKRITLSSSINLEMKVLKEIRIDKYQSVQFTILNQLHEFYAYYEAISLVTFK